VSALINEYSIEGNKVGLTYISVAVTGVPTRNLANRKLKMREVDPNGATYSDDSCQRETRQSGKGLTSSHVLEGEG
jgi:hypothetical protein